MSNINPKVIEKIKARLFQAESKGAGGYKAINDKAVKGTKPTYALGKYQFVPSIWWKSIQKFAKEKKYPPINEHEDFLNNPSLQEEFFEKYVTETVIPKVESLMKHNKRNLDFDEVAQLVHMNNSGDKVKVFMQGGNFDVDNSANNTEVTKYLERGRRGLEAEGLTGVKPVEIMSKEQVEEKTNEFFSKRDAIVNDEARSDGAKQSLLENLKREYGNQGVINEINSASARRDAEAQNSFNSDRTQIKKLYEQLSTGEDDNINREYDPNTGRITLKGTNNYGKMAIRDMVKATGGKLREDVLTTNSADGGSTLRKALGSVTFDLKNGGKNSKYLVEAINKFAKLDQPMTIDKLSTDIGLKEKEGGFFGNSASPKLYRKLNFEKELDKSTLIGQIDSAKYNQNLEKDLTINSEPTKESAKTETEKISDKNKEVAAIPEETDYLSLYQELDAPETVEYDEKNFKREIPFDAFISGAMGLKGLAAADNDIPMRKEQLSAGVQDYINKMQELSNIGLPPELEASAKDSLANAAQLGIDNITRQSNGNRNLVLGNQGQVDMARMKGEVDLSVADFQAKVEAMNNYGEAMKYVNEFKANKDIANTQIQQRIAIQDREAGGELASAGFSSMIDSIRSQKERAPGTPYHQLMSKYSMDAFGYDPNMKDDGTGNVVGTKSHFLGQKDKINSWNKSVKNINETLPTFDKDKMNLFNELSGKVGYNANKVSELTGFLQNNETSNINLDNTQAALKDNNFDLLLNSRPTPEVDPMQANENASAKINDISQQYL